MSKPNTPKTPAIAIIGLFASGLFVLFLNIFNQQIVNSSSNQVNNDNQNTVTIPSAISDITVSSSLASVISSQADSTSTLSNQASTTSAKSSTASKASIAPTPAQAPANSSGYKDGTFKATATYNVPRSRESIAVSITLKNGVVTEVSDTNSAYSGESGAYQSSFDSSIKGQVVGKKISSVSVSRVGGASLTTSAFMSAISSIASQAKA